MSGLFTSLYDRGQIVYLKTDGDQCPRMVVEVSFTLGGATIYVLACCTETSRRYEAEISPTKLLEAPKGVIK